MALKLLALSHFFWCTGHSRTKSKYIGFKVKRWNCEMGTRLTRNDHRFLGFGLFPR